MLKKWNARKNGEQVRKDSLVRRLEELLTGDRELEQMAWCMSAYLENGGSDTAFLTM